MSVRARFARPGALARAATLGSRQILGRRTSGGVPRAVAAAILLPLGGLAIVAVYLAGAPAADRPFLLAAVAVAVVAGLSATTIGVFGGILVPGLLLLGVDPRVAAPLSLVLQLIVIPVGATSHYRLGNVQRGITVPLVIGGAIGAMAGAMFASSVPGEVIARLVALVIVVVGFIVLVSLRNGYASGVVPHEEVHPAQIGGIGLTAGFASGISGAGWGPIGVKLLILSRIEPRHAIGSSLVGRIFMALSAVVGYALTAWATAGVTFQLGLLVPLLAGSVAAMVPGAYVVSRLGRGRASAAVALLSIGLALPTLIWG
ncbi:MAG: sulfite exporter TauE/SafE family protein [Candidatus Limnocylindrales bacterium]